MRIDKLGIFMSVAVVWAGGQARAQTPAGPSGAPAMVPMVPVAPVVPPVQAPMSAPASGAEPGTGPASASTATPAPAPASAMLPAPPAVTGWRTVFYGFAELDTIYDTTQSYGPASNNNMLARPGSYAGAHPRDQYTVNNSQLGLRVAAPDFRRVHTSGQVEVDFFGVQPSDATEQATFTTPSVRLRLVYLKVETPFVDLLAGQYHDLFAWGGEGFYQNSVAFLGVGGEIYHRNPQVRFSKTWEGPKGRVEIALASVRPVQRDSAAPDMQGGLKVSWNGRRGATAQGFGRPEIRPLALGVSGVVRRFAVAEFLTNPGDAKTAYGWGAAVNAFLPVIPARSATDKSNALSLTGEFTIGTGISDLYTGLTGGALFPLLPDPSGGITPPPLYRPNIDSGIVTFDANGNLKTIDWRAYVVGLQYYLPIRGGAVWLAATYSRLESGNILSLTPEASRGGVFIRQEYVDASLFFTITPAVQLGLSLQRTRQTFGDRPFNGPHPEGENFRGEGGLRLYF